MPITSNVSRIYPSEALVTLQGRQGKAMADQLTTVSKQRMEGREITSEEMTSVEVAIRVQLGLSWIFGRIGSIVDQRIRKTNPRGKIFENALEFLDLG